MGHQLALKKSLSKFCDNQTLQVYSSYHKQPHELEHDSIGFGTDHDLRNGQRSVLCPFAESTKEDTQRKSKKAVA